MGRRLPFVVSAATAIGMTAVLAAAVLRADPIVKVTEDQSLFGHLDQQYVICPLVACGPTAATNSFVYLQNMYPKIYGTKLVPTTDPLNPSITEERDVANTLEQAKYMNKNTSGNGVFTTWEDFIAGKEAYIDDTAGKDSTDFAAMADDLIVPGWRNDNASGRAKPSYVQDNTKPTIDFLIAQLQEGEDVEILAEDLVANPDGSGGPGKQGHYLTLTGLTWDYGTNTGTIMFIDPDCGCPQRLPNGNPFFLDPSGYLRSGTPAAPRKIIAVAVAESPTVPEPASWCLLASALLCCAAMRRAKTAGCSTRLQ